MAFISLIIFRITQWINYWLHAVDAHSLQAPFAFDFYTTVVSRKNPKLQEVEALRNELKNDHSKINVLDLGAGSTLSSENTRTISYIAKTSATKPKVSQLLRRIADYCEARVIMELGTSLGFNTLYLSQKNDAEIFTIEGSPEIAATAGKNFEELSASNISLIQGNIDQVLPETLKTLKKVDLVYMDANHTFEATVQYFEWLYPYLHEHSVVVIDDIHWSPEMKNAWNELIRRPEISMSMDLFQVGILFFKKGVLPARYIIEF